MNNSFVKPKKLRPKKGLIPDIRIVNVLLVNDEGQVVLFKRSEDNSYFPGYFHVISGKLKGKENFTDCLKREILEETGIKVKDYDISKIGEKRYTKWDDKTWEIESFDVLIHNSSIVLNKEHSEYILVNPLEIGNLKVTPQVKEMFKIYLKYWGFDKKGMRKVERIVKEYRREKRVVKSN